MLKREMNAKAGASLIPGVPQKLGRTPDSPEIRMASSLTPLWKVLLVSVGMLPSCGLSHLCAADRTWSPEEMKKEILRTDIQPTHNEANLRSVCQQAIRSHRYGCIRLIADVHYDMFLGFLDKIPVLDRRGMLISMLLDDLRWPLRKT
jgi:hypothetical protein